MGIVYVYSINDFGLMFMKTKIDSTFYFFDLR